MAKNTYVGEFPFKSSAKVIYNYISTPGGLQQWFSENVSVDSDHKFRIEWDGEIHVAIVTKKQNKSAKFEFEGDDLGNVLELRLVIGELDGSTYLEVHDTSDNSDNEDLQDLWEGLVGDLKEIVGG